MKQQLAQLRPLDCDEIYTDQMNCKTARRDGLQAALTALEASDQLMAAAFDRLRHNRCEPLDIAQELDSKNVALRSLLEDIDTATFVGRMFYSICAICAQFERDLISDRTKAGLAAAKASCQRGGRLTEMDAEMRNVAEQKRVCTDMSIFAIAQEYGISPSTIYNVVPGGRSAAP